MAHVQLPQTLRPGDVIAGPNGPLEVDMIERLPDGERKITFVKLHENPTQDDGWRAAFLTIALFFVVGVGILLFRQLKGKPPQPAALPEPGPQAPPSEYDAAVQAAIVHPQGPLPLASQAAYRASHPECPVNPAQGDADCAAAYTRITGYLQQLLAVPLPVQTQPLPNACDPLAPAPQGLACVEKAGVWVLVPTAGGAPAPSAPNEVGVSEDYEQVTVGAQWTISTLDAWIEGERQVGRLAVRDDWDFTEAGLPSPLWDALGRPGAREAYEQELAGKDLGLAQGLVLSSTAARTLRRFAESHYVHGISGGIRMVDLPETEAVQEFFNYMARYIAKFQKRSF